MSKIKKYLPLFVIYWITNSLLLYLAALIFPAYFTLGNWRFSMVTASVVSGLIWTGLVFLISPAVKKVIKLDGTTKMMFVYWLSNFVALWITARLAPYFGFGTSKFTWIAGLALVADLVQYVVWKAAKLKT